MNRFQVEFNKHPIHNKLNSFKSLFENIAKNQYDDENIIHELNRMEKVIDSVITTIKDADPDLCNLSLLSNMQPNLNNAYNNLNSFLAGKNNTHLQTANNQLTGLFPYIQQFERFRSSASIRSAAQTASKLNKQATKLISSYVKKKDNMQVMFKDTETAYLSLKEEIDSQVIRLDKAITDFHEKFQNNQSKRNEQFNTLVEDKVNEYRELLNERVKTYDELAITLENNVDRKTKDLFIKAKNDIAKIEITKEKAKDYLKIITNVGTSGQFSKYAKSEGKFAIGFQLGALFLMVIAIILSIYMLFKGQLTQNWLGSITRLALLSMFSAPISYCMQQAGKHKKRQLYYRKMELELSTIDTFIENLDNKNREDLKIEITRKLFGSSNPELIIDEVKRKGKGQITINDIFTLLKDIGFKKEHIVELLNLFKSS